MENLLSDTYGITIYQEQVMLLSQKLANFSKGDADRLRKGMGKKDKDVINELKPMFLKGCKDNDYDEKIVLKIWEDWEKFASYAFNKSHSTCYSFIGFQTAYLKSHYPSEYMASVLTHWKHDITKISEYMEECRRMGVVVNSCDVNESYGLFDAAIVFAPVDEVTDTAIKSVKKGGTVVIATVGNIPNFLAFEEKTIRGTLIGSRKDMEQVIKISQKNNFEVVTEIFPLEQANQALQKLKTSDIEARAVLIP